MSTKQNAVIDAERLDLILDNMVNAVSDSKDEIFEIGEQSRQEYSTLEKELFEIKEKVAETIDQHDNLEKQARLSRSRLAEVSSNFVKYSETQVRETYEKANKIQIELSVVRSTEKQLRERRDDIERRLLRLKETVSKAEKLAGQVSVVLNYLNGDLKKVGELIADAKQKQAFGLKIIEAQEEERKRLSREIHDGPAQILAHVLLGSDLIERIHHEQGPEAANREFAKFRGMIKNALYDVRRIIYDLRPMTLDDLGLIPTLQKYLNRMKEQAPEFNFEFRSIGEHYRDNNGRLPLKMEVALFRLVQEAVQNAIKHSKGNFIQVLIEFRSAHVSLLVRDNGSGFDLSHQDENDHSFGLIGMKERVDLLEGDMSIQSEINQGTAIRIKIPLLKEVA